MITFLFEILLAIVIAGLFIYLARYAAAYFGLPQPVIVVVTVIVVVVLIWWIITALPGAGAGLHNAHPIR